MGIYNKCMIPITSKASIVYVQLSFVSLHPTIHQFNLVIQFKIMCEAYEVGFDFGFPRNNQNNNK